MKTKEEVDALFEQVKHLFESDEPIEHPWEVHPHEFTESENANILAALPEDTDESIADNFMQHLGRAIGSYHRLCDSDGAKMSNSEARMAIGALCKSVLEARSRFVNLPAQLHNEIDLALQHVLQSRDIEQGGEAAPYIWSFTEPYSDATKNWVTQFLAQLEELASALALIEAHRKSNTGGKPVDRAMSYMSLKIAIVYKECFGHDPAPTEGKSFERILAVATEIVGRHGASFYSVMHYVRKAVKDLKSVK